MQGALVFTLLAEQNGYPGIWNAGSSTFGGTPGCLKTWQHALTWPINWPGGVSPWTHRFTINKWVDSMVNQVYPGQLSATGFPTAAGTGYGFGFTDWLVIPRASAASAAPSGPIGGGSLSGSRSAKSYPQFIKFKGVK